jgi:hypothetical protein
MTHILYKASVTLGKRFYTPQVAATEKFEQSVEKSQVCEYHCLIFHNFGSEHIVNSHERNQDAFCLLEKENSCIGWATRIHHQVRASDPGQSSPLE